MSRCFPFPPQGYIRNNGARNDEALIDSIKLQRAMEKSKEDRKKEKKEKKREKKERKKEKKEKKLKEGGTSSHIDSKKLKHVDELKETKADGELRKGEDLENEQLERSGITEEHEQPVSSSREPCCLSDSTQSSKRKRSTSPSSSHDNGTAIRIRLPLRKHKEPEQSISDQCGPSSSLNQGTGGSDHGLQCLRNNAEANQSLVMADSKHHIQNLNLVHSDAPVTSSSHRETKRHDKQILNLVHSDAPITNSSDRETKRHDKQNLNLVLGDAPVTNSRHKETKRMAAMYKSLLQIPLTVEALDSEGVDDWLFRSDLTEAKPEAKKVKSVTDAGQCSTPSVWARAQYLPEVGIYALPYVVPY